jgi:hypothetical protein
MKIKSLYYVTSLLLDILEDIYYDRLEQYDIKSLSWYQDHYRLRKWDIRFIFEKTAEGNVIHHIGNRGDVYKQY